MPPRTIVVLTAVVTVLTFAVVQDRVTAAGARRYVALQRETVTRDAPPVSIDEVVRPAVQRSVTQGLLWSGGVLAGGLAMAAYSGRRRRGE
jgi:hypothetical protein